MCFRKNENCCFNKYRKPALLPLLCCARVFLYSSLDLYLLKDGGEKGSGSIGLPYCLISTNKFLQNFSILLSSLYSKILIRLQRNILTKILRELDKFYEKFWYVNWGISPFTKTRILVLDPLRKLAHTYKWTLGHLHLLALLEVVLANVRR